MTDLTAAQTILAQLGGARFKAMTGARDFVGSPNALYFALPRITGRLAPPSKVRIELGDDDLYRVTFYRRSAAGPVPMVKLDGVYADSLQEVFTRHTGLDTKL